MDATTLGEVPRATLQKLAKQAGLKANGKTAAIIAQLLDKYPEGVPRLVEESGLQPGAASVKRDNEAKDVVPEEERLEDGEKAPPKVKEPIAGRKGRATRAITTQATRARPVDTRTSEESTSSETIRNDVGSATRLVDKGIGKLGVTSRQRESETKDVVAETVDIERVGEELNEAKGGPTKMGVQVTQKELAFIEDSDNLSASVIRNIENAKQNDRQVQRKSTDKRAESRGASPPPVEPIGFLITVDTETESKEDPPGLHAGQRLAQEPAGPSLVDTPGQSPESQADAFIKASINWAASAANVGKEGGMEKKVTALLPWDPRAQHAKQNLPSTTRRTQRSFHNIAVESPDGGSLEVEPPSSPNVLEPHNKTANRDVAGDEPQILEGRGGSTLEDVFSSGKIPNNTANKAVPVDETRFGGISKKDIGSLLREFTELAEETVFIKNEMKEAAMMTQIAQRRLGLVNVGLEDIRRTRVLLERHYFTKLKGDERLQKGTWAKPGQVSAVTPRKDKGKQRAFFGDSDASSDSDSQDERSKEIPKRSNANIRIPNPPIANASRSDMSGR
ncbi:hypothetical protein PHLCEN_2v10409 [Hermanssonia centrifuga]|uniref:Uncharacterized protein n=1 Tax=Hermanssonia centrifuga TaxID=98765 RepID=A0A2R6NMZ9_9APHY|nr:hypothetical protein PHLCEN_2v10409 [Hermanssonia centrifuga]